MSTSTRSPLALAALATVAIPGLDVVAARPARHPSADFDVASLLDATGRRWTVRAPRTTVAGAALEAEVDLLQGLARAVDDELLPFDVPRPAGFAALPEGGRAMTYRELRGAPMAVESMSEQLARQVGRAVARIHDLDTTLVADAGLPVYDAESYRRRRLAELDEAARTGHVPAPLLRRWEEALEDVRLWRFHATAVHGDLAGEHLLADGDEVCAVLDWAEARVADPADDLAWLLAATSPQIGDVILAEYTARRLGRVDEFLSARTLLASELALPRWLMHGVRTRDNSVIDDAIEMLRDLESAVEGADPIAHSPTTTGDWTTGPVPMYPAYPEPNEHSDETGWATDSRDAPGAYGDAANSDTARPQDGGSAVEQAPADRMSADQMSADQMPAEHGQSFAAGTGAARPAGAAGDPDRAVLPDQSATAEFAPPMAEPDYVHADPDRGDDSPTMQLPSA